MPAGKYSGAPVVSDDGKAAQAQGVGQVQHILRRGGDLTGTHGFLGKERCRFEAAQPGGKRSKTSLMKRWRNTRVSGRVVGPAVQQNNRSAVPRSTAEIGDAQHGCIAE